MNSLGLARWYASARGLERQNLIAAAGLLAAAVALGLVGHGPHGRADADRLIEPLVMISPVLASVLAAGATRRGRLFVEVSARRRIWPIATAGIMLMCAMVASLGVVSLALAGYGLEYLLHTSGMVGMLTLLATILSRAISGPWWWVPIFVVAFTLLTPGLIPLRFNIVLSLDAASPSILLSTGVVIVALGMLALPRFHGSDT